MTVPGLNVRTLQGLLTPRDTEQIHARIRAHFDQHEGYLALSGGKDSLVAAHLARAVAPDIPMVFFDSGMEFPETYAYLEDLATEWDLNLHVLRPVAPILETMHATGLWDHAATPHPGPHPDLHQALIAEPATRAHALYGPGEIWGVRAQESRGRTLAYANALTATTCGCCATAAQRRAHHGGTITRTDGTTAYGPVWDWSTQDIWGHIARHRLPLNPVYDKLARLGAPQDCLRISLMIDGGRLQHGRATWLKRGWPALFDELTTILPRLREYV